MTYRVTITKSEVYEVEAENAQQATDIASEMCDADPDAWTAPVDSFTTEVIGPKRVEVYFSDLDPAIQHELLKAAHIAEARDANWDIMPLWVYEEVEDFGL